MKSTQELYAEKYEEKIAAKEAARLKAIRDGLNQITSLDQDKVGQELPRSAYVAHAHEDLRKIMVKGHTVPDKD